VPFAIREPVASSPRGIRSAATRSGTQGRCGLRSRSTPLPRLGDRTSYLRPEAKEVWAGLRKWLCWTSVSDQSSYL